MPVKSIPINLDRERRLCFNFNAFAELQRECGLTILDVQKFAAYYIAFKSGSVDKMIYPLYELRAFIWAGLLDENPRITLKEVGNILEDLFLVEEKAEEIGEKLGLALMESTFYKEGLKKAGGPKLRTVKTGKRKTTSKKTEN